MRFSKLSFYALLIALVLTAMLYACVIAPFSADAQAQNVPAIYLEQPGRKGDQNLIAKWLGEWLGGVQIVLTPLGQTIQTVRIAFDGFDSPIKPKKQSAWKQAGGAAVQYGATEVGNQLARVAYRHGGPILGGTAAVAVQVGTKVWGNETAKQIEYDGLQIGIAKLPYQICLGSRCETGKATLYAEIKVLSASEAPNWAKFYVVAAGNEKKTMTQLNPPILAGEGRLSEQESFIQEALLTILLNENEKFLWPTLLGRDTLLALKGRAISIPGVMERLVLQRRTAAVPTPTPVALPPATIPVPTPTPAPTPCPDGTERFYRADGQPTCAKLVIIHLEPAQAPALPIPTPTPTPTPTPAPAKTATPVVTAPPSVGFVEIYYDSAKPKMQGENVKKVLAYMVNKNYLGWNPAWDFAWGSNADRGWREVEAAASTAGIPGVVKDGRVNASEWQWLSGLPPQTFALNPQMQQTEARLRARQKK